MVGDKHEEVFGKHEEEEKVVDKVSSLKRA